MVFSQNEIIIMIGVVSVLLICITILTILDIKEYLKAKKTSVNVDEEVSFGPEYHEESIVETEPVMVVQDDAKEEVYVTTSEETKEANDEIFLEEMEDENFEEEKVTEPLIEEEEEVELPKVEVTVNQEIVEPVLEKKEKKELDIFEELSEIEENLPNNKDDVTNFEMEQERTAIISLDELMQKSNELYNDNEIVQYDDGDEPISIDEVISRFNREQGKANVEKEVPLVSRVMDSGEKPYSRKETIPFISSVYGIERGDSALEFENTANYEKMSRQKYNDFMAKLREMDEKE